LINLTGFQSERIYEGKTGNQRDAKTPRETKGKEKEEALRLLRNASIYTRINRVKDRTIK